MFTYMIIAALIIIYAFAISISYKKGQNLEPSHSQIR